MTEKSQTEIVSTELEVVPPQGALVSMQRCAAIWKNAIPGVLRFMDNEGAGILEAALLHSFRASPRLGECSPESVVAAVHTCAELKLYPGQQGHIYLIPYGLKCQIQIGYKGMVELAQRSGLIRSIDAGPIYRHETEHHGFVWQRSPAKLVIPGVFGVERRDEDIVAAYCRVETTQGGVLLEVIDRQEIDARRARGATKRTDTPWHTDFARMARKSAIRKLFAGGTVPMSTEMRTALAVEAVQEVQVVEPQPTVPSSNMEALRVALGGEE